MILRTLPQQAYIVTAPSHPVTVRAIMPDGRRVTLLVTDYRHQHGFVAISDEVEIDSVGATIAEAGPRVAQTSRETATGGQDGNYVVFSDEGHVEAVHFPTATDAAHLLSLADLTPSADGQWFHLDLPEVIDASHLLCQPAGRPALSRPHLVLNLPRATSIVNMCTCAHVRTITAHLPSVEVAGSCVFAQCNRGGLEMVNVGEMSRLTDGSFMFSCSIGLHAVLGSFPALTAMDYMFAFSPLLDAAELCDMTDWSRVVTAVAAFAGCRCLSDLDVHAPRLVHASSIWSRTVNPGPPVNARLDLPEALDCSRMLLGCLPLVSLCLNAPKATDMTSVCSDCGALCRVEGRFDSLESGDGAFRNCRRLTQIAAGFPSLQSGRGMFLNAGLDADSINAVMASLPRICDAPGMVHLGREGDGTVAKMLRIEPPPLPDCPVITFTGCPGAAGCDPGIAVARGWIVEL